MPPRTRKTAAPAAEAAETLLGDGPADPTSGAETKRAAPAKQPPPLCEECFPAGWPEREDAYSAGCEHGSWLHPDRAAAIRP